jgi:hypothetical protein
MRPSELEKVYFPLDQEDESAFTPAAGEDLWCQPVTDNLFIVDNIPFFVRDVSLEDEIMAERRDGTLTFVSVVKPSRNSTIHIFVKQAEIKQQIKEKLESMSCGVEVMERLPLFAVSMPATAPTEEIFQYLDQCDEDGLIGFEESSVRYQ